MNFFIFLLVAVIAYLIWRIADQLPDLIFRISEMQRDLAELRRAVADGQRADMAPREPPAPRQHVPADVPPYSAETRIE
jgi:hypothetical protein